MFRDELETSDWQDIFRYLQMGAESVISKTEDVVFELRSEKHLKDVEKSLWYTRIEQKIIGTCREALFTELFGSTGELVEMETIDNARFGKPFQLGVAKKKTIFALSPDAFFHTL